MSINVTNIVDVPALDLSFWVATNLLNIRLPEYGANSTPNVRQEVVPLLPVLANRLAFATELYIVCLSAKAALNNDKKYSDAAKKAEATQKLIQISAHIEVLYRTIQTIDSLRETASRMMTGLSDRA